jgi:hypothetical protein
MRDKLQRGNMGPPRALTCQQGGKLTRSVPVLAFREQPQATHVLGLRPSGVRALRGLCDNAICEKRSRTDSFAKNVLPPPSVASSGNKAPSSCRWLGMRLACAVRCRPVVPSTVIAPRAACLAACLVQAPGATWSVPNASAQRWQSSAKKRNAEAAAASAKHVPRARPGAPEAKPAGPAGKKASGAAAGAGGAAASGSAAGSTSSRAGGGSEGDIVMHMRGLTKILPGGRVLFKDVSLAFQRGAKIGVLGLNGTGKSSLLKIIGGVDSEFDGDMWRKAGLRIGYLAQEPRLDEGKSVHDNIMDGLREKTDLLARFDAVNAAMADPDADLDALCAEQAAVQAQIEAADCWNLHHTLAIAKEALRLVAARVLPAWDGNVVLLFWWW